MNENSCLRAVLGKRYRTRREPNMTPYANFQETDGDEKVTLSMLTTWARHGLIVSARSRVEATRRRRISPIAITALASVAFAGAYFAYHRIGTTANADAVEFTPNLAGGFLAVGMTEDQPGFFVLSALDQKEVEVRAAQTINRLAGTHTIVDVQTSNGKTRTRLRGPQIILVTKEGRVTKYAVDWTMSEFNALREAADCSYEAATRKHRCGAPFTELKEAFADWPVERVPDRVLAFLAAFKDHGAKR